MSDSDELEQTEKAEATKTALQEAQKAREIAEYVKVGRKTVVDEEALRKLLEAFAMGCTDEEACYFAGIGKTAFYEYQKAHKEFAEQKKLLKERPIFLARQTLLSGVQSDPDLALKFLERKRKGEFSLRRELTGENGQPIQVNVDDPNILKTLLWTAQAIQEAELAEEEENGAKAIDASATSPEQS